MDTLQFLQRVLPTDGYFVTTVINKDGPRQGYFSTVEELAKVVLALDQRGNNTYFAISSYKEKGSRKQENVRATKVLVLDVDCGASKPFPSWKEGLVALGKFIADTGLPKPMIIHSGNGLHVYWTLAEELEPIQWKPLADALKTAAADNQFPVDAGPTANSALVLRPIGTHNPKNGSEVRLLMDAPQTTTAVMTAALSRYIRFSAVDPIKKSTSALAQALETKVDIPLASSHLVASKCKQVKWATENQSEVAEPFWYALLGVAAYCQDPEDTAIKWSENHPDFDATKTIQKLYHWKQSTTGPTTCNRFATDRPEGCKGCRFKDKIGTPARLGVQYKEVQAPQEAPDKIAFEVDIPKPFKRTADGIKVTIDESDVDICKFDIYPVGYGKDESLGYETVRYHWKRPHIGWTELSMRQAYLTVPRIKDFTTDIADQGIVLSTEKQTEFFQLMLRAYMEELRQKRAMTNLYSTMGWKENFTQFVIGDTLLRRSVDGTVSEEDITLSSGSQRLGSELYGKLGTLESWSQLTTLTEKLGLPAHRFALCVSLSAPLYAFTGLKGLTISLYGPTGSGKTLAQLWMQSVWGNPDRLHFSAKFTQNTLFGRMGLYANMPMTIDEATMMVDKEVGDFLYWVSQGRDKARLNRNAEEKDAKTFSMPVTVSTNKSMQSKLISSGLDTDAQMARLLEVTVPSHPMFVRDSAAGRKLYNFINTNYGHAGAAFVKKLLELGPDGIRAAIADATENFNKTYKSKFSGEERYWEQAIILADLAGKLAEDWGIIQFDPSVGTEWVLNSLGSIRRSVLENKVDAFDMLSEFLNENVDKAITVFHNGAGKPTVDYSRMPRSSVYVRFDLHRKSASDQFDHGSVTIDRTNFRRWISTRGADYKTFVQELTDENVNVTPKSNKAYLAKDSPIKLPQSYVIAVNLNHPRLMGILEKANEDVDSMSIGQLRAL